MKTFLFLFLSFISTIAFGQYTVDNLPNPKEGRSRSYVSNPNAIISADDAGIIDNICAEIEKQDSFQVTFVILGSIDSEVPKDFAGRLFNKWGVGHTGRDDGLLVLFVMDQKRVEFETGYGTETVMTDYACVQLQQESMIPYFKDGEFSRGLVIGAQAIQNALSGQTVDRFDAQSLEEEEIRLEQEHIIESRNNTRSLIITTIVWHAVGLILFLIALLIARFRNDPYGKYNTIKYFGVWIWAVLFPITHIFVVIFAKKLKQRYRDMIRFSGRTDEIMRKLSEEDEDEYLNRGQVTEELVKSVDYDVWITETSDDVLVLAYRPLFSKYSTCPKCHFKTYYKVYDRTVIMATYTSSGKGERKHECANCKHVDLKTYRIPRLNSKTRSSSSSGWSGSSGGSFSGGGSFGGGSSGGGGGGSSW
ncbi:MAG: TPM domain-containing protein [Crocinitomicaceae bacterium]|nr:TPM domain-containing protein [Flavobacteriales bacterium]NQZ37905.1 TPM domain-containing protein [Crocinitomicaceae bacterium]